MIPANFTEGDEWECGDPPLQVACETVLSGDEYEEPHEPAEQELNGDTGDMRIDGMAVEEGTEDSDVDEADQEEAQDDISGEVMALLEAWD